MLFTVSSNNPKLEAIEVEAPDEHSAREIGMRELHGPEDGKIVQSSYQGLGLVVWSV